MRMGDAGPPQVFAARGDALAAAGSRTVGRSPG